MTDSLDVIILGGGCAGLALARELALRPHALKIMIVEPRTTYVDDRTWCFWTRRQEGSRPAARAQWSRWQFSIAGKTITHETPEWLYNMVSSADYYADATSVIEATDRVQLRLGQSAGAITMQDGMCIIETTTGPIVGRVVIDTRPPTQGWLRRAPLTQLFSGIEVEVDEEIFDPHTAALMCDMRASGNAFAFDYILPLSNGRALFEHTVFTTQPHNPAMLDQACLDKVAHVCGRRARILRRERGWLPMGLPAAPVDDPAIVRAGTPGGALRASSGYAFRRIQNWASRCADSLVASGRPVTEPIDPPFLAFMDRVFLKVIAGHINSAPDIFQRIACALDGDGFARFMSEEATLSDWSKVASALPKGMFLAAAGASLHVSRPQAGRPC